MKNTDIMLSFVLLGLFTLFIIFAIDIVAFDIVNFTTILILSGALWIIFIVIENHYYKSNDFISVKNSIKENTDKCNDLNRHIEDLKKSYINGKSIDYGEAKVVDNSSYNYKRPELSNFEAGENIHNCSLSVCRNAQKQPFKYICKYFNIKHNEKTLENFENILNNFSAAEQGKILLTRERDGIVNSIQNKIPEIIIKLRKRKLLDRLGFNEIDFSTLYFPKYSFNYVSSGGNSSMSTEVIFNLYNLERFISYLSDLVKFRNSVAGQRALMTSKLRSKIKERDDNTCQNCGLSTREEPNLLLEIDHIMPLSKGGITSEDNLQTLCWKCNRKKSNKII